LKINGTVITRAQINFYERTGHNIGSIQIYLTEDTKEIVVNKEVIKNDELERVNNSIKHYEEQLEREKKKLLELNNAI
jgi:hypothetical protein